MFSDPRDPPTWRALSADERAQFDLGHALFNTQFVPPDTLNAGRRAGLGPLFNASSCDQCHSEGAHGRGPSAEGPAPSALVMELQRGDARARNDTGDPVYGHVFNTQAASGFSAEGVLIVHYDPQPGRYQDGQRWSLRVPRYELNTLAYGALDAATILAPRIAPNLFGLGLLEAVPRADISAGRFDWQLNVSSVAQQTSRALSREMGVTNSLLPLDDCTPAQSLCHAGASSRPELPDELLRAVLAYEHWLAVPTALPSGPLTPTPAAARLFATLGCAACHRPSLPLQLDSITQPRGGLQIAPYTDLQGHDLGAALADRSVGGEVITSRWRTAPLWGLGYRLRHPHDQTYLHDGRARSVEEAILWHGGEAQAAQRAFIHSSAAQRAELLQFLGCL